MQQEIDILVNGKPVRQIAHEGRIFILAKAGSEYEIRLRNHSIDRVTGVVSVDGLNVVDGKSATQKGGGYIINGRGSYTIRGFRTSNEEVHPFVFNKKKKSYAAKSEDGDIKDCGVIGAIFWSEKPKPQPVIEKHIHHDHYHPYPAYPWRRPWYPNDPYFYISSGQCGLSGGGSFSGENQVRSMNMSLSNNGSIGSQNTAMLRSSSVKSAEFDLGTEFAKHSVADKVETVDFEWGRPSEPIKIYYASRAMLQAMSVPVEAAREVAFPEPFKGFCKPPLD